MESQLRRGESAWGVRSLGLGTHGIQVATYKEGHHYEWHTDSSAPVGGVSRGRIMSVTVQLSPPEAYTGGEVEMGTHGNISTAIGTMALFPSYLPHKVHRVTSGVRHSIVAWFAGASHVSPVAIEEACSFEWVSASPKTLSARAPCV
jgi:predicted 2-oxoglutarate/Fe(II)-dependent dioxygenase YbiX